MSLNLIVGTNNLNNSNDSNNSNQTNIIEKIKEKKSKSKSNKKTNLIELDGIVQLDKYVESIKSIEFVESVESIESIEKTKNTKIVETIGMDKLDKSIEFEKKIKKNKKNDLAKLNDIKKNCVCNEFKLVESVEYVESVELVESVESIELDDHDQLEKIKKTKKSKKVKSDGIEFMEFGQIENNNDCKIKKLKNKKSKIIENIVNLNNVDNIDIMNNANNVDNIDIMNNANNVDNVYDMDNLSNLSNLSSLSNLKKVRKAKIKNQNEISGDYFKLAENKIIYEYKETSNNNEKLQSIFKVIDKSHNLLYQAENIVGQKALQIIMSLLFIKLIQPLLSDTPQPGKFDLLNKNHYRKIYNLSISEDINELEEIFEYFKDLKKMTRLSMLDIRNEIINDAIKQMGEILRTHPLTKMIHNDNNFIKVREASTIQRLINDVIDDVNFADFQDNEDVIGEIYEHFLNNYSKTNSKELGQFFTPRKLMKLILGYKKNQINTIFENVRDENISIYDSCMGTGGWIVTAYNTFKSLFNNIIVAGGEVEPETYQYALMNISLCLHKFPTDVSCNSSLTHVNTNKHHLITTNPPFNSKKQIKFSQIKSNFERDTYTTLENSLKPEDIYHLKKDDPPIQFLELNTFKLKDGGMCIIVLPYGEFFSGSSYSKTRDHFMQITDITDIIIVPGGIFTHTDIKTCVLIFKKDATGTKNITFSKINDNCDKIEKIITVSIDDIRKEPKLSWFLTDYLIDNCVNDLMIKMPNFQWIEFGEVFTLEKGKLQSSKVEECENGDSVLINCSLYGNYKKINTFSQDGSNLFISTFMPKGNNGSSYIVLTYYDGKCDYIDLMSRCIINDAFMNKINLKFMYYYLLSIKSHLEIFYEKGSCNKSLDMKNFNRMKIPIPTIEQQQNIVNNMDSSNDKLSHTIKIIKSLYHSIKLNFLCQLRKYNQTQNAEWTEFGKIFSLIKGRLQSSKIIEDDNGDSVFINLSKTREFKKINGGTLQGENIFISNTSPIGLIQYYNGKCSYSDLLYHININEDYINKINLKYIYYYLKIFQVHIEKTYSKGACNQCLDVYNFNRMKLCIPTIEFQNNLIKFINDIEDDIKFQKGKMEKYKNECSDNLLLYMQMETSSSNDLFDSIELSYFNMNGNL